MTYFQTFVVQNISALLMLAQGIGINRLIIDLNCSRTSTPLDIVDLFQKTSLWVGKFTRSISKSNADTLLSLINAKPVADDIKSNDKS